MAEATRYLRRRRERGQRRVLAVTVTCGIGATALTGALGALLAIEHPAAVSRLPTDLAHHAHHPEGSAAADTDAQSALDTSPQAAQAPGRPEENMVRDGNPPTAHGSSPAAHSHHGG